MKQKWKPMQFVEISMHEIFAFQDKLDAVQDNPEKVWQVVDDFFWEVENQLELDPNFIKELHELDLESDFVELKEIENLFDDNVEDYSVVAGSEMYAENWFYTFFEDEFIAEGLGYEIGMVGIDKTYGPFTDANGEVWGPYDFEGSYYCFVTEDANGNQTLDVMVSMPINTDPFVPNVYNYPTFLEMFKNSQYLQPTGGSSNEYYTSKLSCVNDFVSNFQMTETLASLGAVPTGVYVEYLPSGSDYYAGTKGKECVVFKLEVNYYGALTTIDYVYTDFNTTNVECITQENVDKVIMDIINEAMNKAQESQGE
jgi:hypothetical protein